MPSLVSVPRAVLVKGGCLHCFEVEPAASMTKKGRTPATHRNFPHVGKERNPHVGYVSTESAVDKRLAENAQIVHT